MDTSKGCPSERAFGSLIRNRDTLKVGQLWPILSSSLKADGRNNGETTTSIEREKHGGIVLKPKRDYNGKNKAERFVRPQHRLPCLRALGALDERKILKLCVVVVKVKTLGPRTPGPSTKPGGGKGACQQRVG